MRVSSYSAHASEMSQFLVPVLVRSALPCFATFLTQHGASSRDCSPDDNDRSRAAAHHQRRQSSGSAYGRHVLLPPRPADSAARTQSFIKTRGRARTDGKGSRCIGHGRKTGGRRARAEQADMGAARHPVDGNDGGAGVCDERRDPAACEVRAASAEAAAVSDCAQRSDCGALGNKTQ
jgi:hypothetical protein